MVKHNKNELNKKVKKIFKKIEKLYKHVTTIRQIE